MLITTPIRMPKIAFHTAWELAGGGPPHPVVGEDQYYMTPELRRSVLAETQDLMTSLGWLRAGRPDSGFLDLLALLTWADRQCYAWTSTVAGGDTAVLVAALGRDAVRVLVDHQTVVLVPGRPHDLAAQLVEMLPDARPAQVGALSVPRDQEAEDDDPLGGGDPTPVDRFHDLTTAPRDGVCQLYTAARTGRGPVARSGPHSAIDITGLGRLLVSDDPASDRVVLRPGSDQAIIDLLESERERIARR